MSKVVSNNIENKKHHHQDTSLLGVFTFAHLSWITAETMSSKI